MAEQAISERVFPGGAVAFGTCTVPLYHQSYGTYTYEAVIPVREDSIWDLGSLTKIMVTTPAIMLLYDRQLLVHDPTAFLLGGVAGHAGLFSTLKDVCRFAQMMLAGGIDLPTNHRLFSEKTVKLFTTPGPTTPLNPRPFALGWDVSARRTFNGYTSAGSFLGPRTFGHTGFTGTSLWIDPDRNFFVILLTNAVHPTAAGGNGFKINEVRTKVADATVIAMSQQAFPHEVLLWHLEPAYKKLYATQNLQPKNAPSSLGIDCLRILSTSRISSETEENMTAIRNDKGQYENVNDLTNTSALSTVLDTDDDEEISKKHSNESYMWERLFPIFFIAIISFIMP